MTRDTFKPKGKPLTQKALLATILRSITGLETRMEELETKTGRMFNELSSAFEDRMEAVEGSQQNHHHHIDILSSRLATPDKPKKEYVLTDADWQRVIKEGWLCEFWSSGARTCGVLLEISPHEDCRYGGIPPSECNRDYMFWRSHCKPLNKPGVMQPYFGQGMPVDGETMVVVQLRDGMLMHCKAIQLQWQHGQLKSDIMAYMVVPTIKKT